MYREKRFFRRVSIIAIIVIISGLFFTVDYLRINSKRSPIFCIAISESYDDGGSNELYGMFYKVNKYVYLDGETEYEIGPLWMKFDKPDKPVNIYEEKDIYNEEINIYNEY